VGTEAAHLAEPVSPPPAGRTEWRGHVAGVVVAAAATIAVDLGGYAAARSLGADVVVGTILVGLAWLTLAAPVFAAGGPTPLDGVLRAGAVADAGVVVLAVLVAVDHLSVAGAVGVYLLWAAVALAECGVVWTAHSRGSRHVVAAVAAFAVLAVSAGPFWANRLIDAADPDARRTRARVVVAVNPVYAVADAIAPEVNFVWHESRNRILYEYSALGRDVVMPFAGWYVTAGVYAVVAAGAGAVAVIRRRR